MSRSLRRTLAIRFAATMGVGLLAAATVAYLGSSLSIGRTLIPALLAVVVLASAATLAGAWWLACWAMRPVLEITEQAQRVEAGTLDQRIVAHAETDEFRGLVAVLNRMLERLEQAFKSQRRITADVSHELRSPLTVLRGEIEVALRTERTPRDYERVLESALEEIDRLSQMSEDVLLITRAESHALPLEREPTDVNELVEQTISTLHGRIEEHGLTVERHLAPAGAVAPIDRELVGRMVFQLLDNAVKFASAEATIRVATEVMNGSGGAPGVRLSVENSGSGIRPEHLPHIFEPFYRGDEARSRGTGTGLGLALAAAIVHLHGGSISASNLAAEGGARVEVQLPAV